MSRGRNDVAFSILGRSFKGRALPPGLASWLDRHWCFPEYRVDTAPYSILLSIVEGSPGPIHGDPVEVSLPGADGLSCRREGHCWEMEDDSGGARIEVLPESTSITTWGWDVGACPAQLLYLAICEALRISGLLPLHAAVVVRDGRATALAGPSGVGKTTTMLRSLCAGWVPLAEDLAWIDPSTLAVYGWDRGIRLWPDGRANLDIMPGEVDDGWETDPDGKGFLSYDRLGASLSGPVPLERIALLERDSDRPSAWEPLPGRAAVRTLWECTGVPFIPAAREMVSRHVAELTGRLEFQRLRLGCTPVPL